MTDRHAGYIVALDHDIREDDAEATIAALKQIKGVLRVKPVVSDSLAFIAAERMRVELAQTVMDALFPKKDTR